MMKRLLIFDYFRGTDSTGFAWLNKDGKKGVVKLPSHPLDLFQMKAFDTNLTGWKSKIFLGHNRAATAGKVNGLNAHPFEFGDIVGAHNGTLFSQDWDDLDKETGVKTDVDSASLYNAINEIGVKNAIEMIHEGNTPQRGAWALTWFDAYEENLYFLKNQHRPLWYAFNKELTKIIWASEVWMIESACAAAKDKWELWEDKKGYSFFPVENNTLYTIPIQELSKKGKTSPPDFRGETIEGKVYVEPPKSNIAPFQGNPRTNTTTSNSSTATIRSDEDNDTTKPFVEISGELANPFGGYIDPADWDEIAKDGCSWCGADIDYNDIGHIVYERHDMVMGRCCSREHHQNIVYADPVRYQQYFGANKQDSKVVVN